MPHSFFDTFPCLNKKEALELLSTPVRKLKISSDYYKAVFSLEKFPGEETENALLCLIELESDDPSIQIAKRKSIEILSRFKCKKAIPSISKCLKCVDPYVVENAVIALSDLDPENTEFHDSIITLLDKNNQNKRVLIQVLSKLNIRKSLPKIKSIVKDMSLSPSIRGAAIAAIAKLDNDKRLINELEKSLYSNNQNDRQSAIEDVINSGSFELLPSVAKSPVSPFFKLRAVNYLWPNQQKKINHTKLLSLLDTLIKDEPRDVNIIHKYDNKKNVTFLINEFYNTDFSKSYLALLTLSEFTQEELWPVLYNQLPHLRRDYGAIYFTIILFRIVPKWNEDKVSIIIDFLYSLLDSNWPDFMKFRPAAILTLIHLNSFRCLDFVPKWIDPQRTPYWACRYAALMGIQMMISQNKYNDLIKKLYLPIHDPHRFVNQKLNEVIKIKSILFN